MRINRTSNQVSFGYHHQLKTLWYINSELQKRVVKGIYGDTLSRYGRNLCTLEHLIPASQNGGLTLDNLALATIKRNEARGDAPLKDFLVPAKAIEYLLQFKDFATSGFSGNKYIAGILETLKKLQVL